MPFRIKIEKEAHDDIQKGITWYNNQSPGLGRKFHSKVKTYFKKIRINPFFQVRYDDVHCLPIKNYPYMIHFTVDESNNTITILGVFNTHRDPKTWRRK